MKKRILLLLALIGCLCACLAAAPAFAEPASDTICVTGADILRGARSNVNRELTGVNITADGVELRGAFEADKPVIKAAVKKGAALTENFSVQAEILQADAGCNVDIGFIAGDVDESWLDPWDFLGIDMNDPGSLAKFKNIGGFTVRFSMSGASASTVMMKGVGENLTDAAFAVAGVTQSVPFASARELTLVKEGGNWSVSANGAVLPLEANATLLNPSGSESAQAFLNKTLDAMLGKQVYAFICMEGGDGASAAVRLKGAGGKTFAAPSRDDPYAGDSSYEKDPAEKIEFSLAENYYLGMPEYADRAFTYLSQPYMDPMFEVSEKGLRLSGRDKLYGVNADVTYLTPFASFDGFSAVLSAGDMPRSTSKINSNISLTLNGQKFASYYAWNSIHVKITFPYGSDAEGFFASVLLWDEPSYPNGVYTPVLRAELPAAYIPAADGDIVVKTAKVDGNYYVYVNGVRFGDGFESALNETVAKIEKGYTDAEGKHSGFYVSTLNTTAYLADGTGVDDGVLSGKASHYLKQIGGKKIVNEQPTLKTAQAPWAPSEKDVTANSIKLSFSAETPDRTDGNFQVDGYLVERWRAGKFDKSFVLKGADNRTFTDTGLLSDTRYTYRVYAVSGADTASPVKLVAYQPIAVKTLAAPTVNVAAGIFIVGGGIALIAALLAIRYASVPKRIKQKRFCAPAPRVKVKKKARPLALALCACLFLGMLSGCGPTAPTPKPEPEPTKGEAFVDTFENGTTPAWKSGVMYNETVLMLKSGDKMPSGKLAFRPKKVISVRSYTLETTYTENKDYTIDAEGNIFLTQNSACPYLNEENLFYKTRPQGVEGLYEFPASSSSVPSLMYTETSYLVEKQICVTYEYDMNEFSKEAVSAADESKLPALRNLLKERAPVRLAVLGDSISEGANSSGKLNIAPYQPIYSSLFRRYVEKTFSVDIDFQNYSMGGMASEWGASRAYAVGQSMPDLVILSFGANDGGTGTDNSVAPVPVATFESNIRAAMANVRKYNPACEFILVSSLMPNPQSGAFGIQGQYAEAMDKIAENDASVVSVNMYALHEYLVFERGKHYVDLSSNNINHPNDFLIRLYAMNIISALWN